MTLTTDYINKFSPLLDIYENSTSLKIEHKILRSFLNSNQLNCQLKDNTSRKKSFISPTESLLFSPLSIIAHNLYLCEGWHTNKTTHLYFCNQDVQIIRLFCECLTHIYKYLSIYGIYLVYNSEDINSVAKANKLKNEFSNSNIYKVYFINDPTRKNPLVRITAGGKNLSRIFIENAYKILLSN